ncbi:MAG: hypothetical protein RLZZ93_616 [Actinomycetota bacterium]
MRVKAMVVLTACVPEPASNSANTAGSGSSSGLRVRTSRCGSGPSSARLRSIMYWYSTESAAGLKYGGSSPSSMDSGISSSRCRRARISISCSFVSFLIWCVALRPSTPEPSVQPLMVLQRMTVGRPEPRFSTAARYAAYSLR